jgi:phosphopantetheinyl transferase
MPIFFQQDIEDDTRLGVWKIEEEEDFFLKEVVLQRAITHPHKRLQHLAGRYLLRHLFPEFPMDLIRIADTRKPYLENEAFHFSISHCNDYAAAIVSRKKRVGVDLELYHSKVERIRNKFLHPEESAMVDRESWPSLPVDPPQLAPLMLLWSAKEAVFKWWSYGHVDFSDQIRIDASSPELSGVLPVRFMAVQNTWNLELHYRLFESFSLSVDCNVERERR